MGVLVGSAERGLRSGGCASLRLSGNRERVREEIRRLVGSSWVQDVVANGCDEIEQIHFFVEACRECGRTPWIPEMLLPELPAVCSDERWVRRVQGQQTLWGLTRQTNNSTQDWLKRFIDVVLAATLLLVLSPVLVLISIAVRVTSRGPIFYRWRVLGQFGRPFVGYKFRSMVRNADSLKAALLPENRMSGPVFKMNGDPRITPLGRKLRKFSLDELPQLLSVIGGDMSLVGPRPVFPEEYRQFELWQMRKLSVRPGMTCLWQIRGRNAIKQLSEWAAMDLEYIDSWSPWLDLRILARTALSVFRGTGW